MTRRVARRRSGGPASAAATAAAAGAKTGIRRPVSEPASAAKPLRIAVATRPALVRDALSRVLSAEPGLTVVAEASDESGIEEVLRRDHPRVLLFDYEALGPDGEGMISRLRRVSPSTRFLVLATRSGADTVDRVLRSGASGLVGKELDFPSVVRAIRSVAAGEVWANRLATAQALEYLSGLSELGIGRRSPNGHLTKRESEIVSEVGLGLRNKEIAGKLKISEKTVRTHLNNIFRKLQLDNRITLALFARELVQPKP